MISFKKQKYDSVLIVTILSIITVPHIFFVVSGDHSLSIPLVLIAVCLSIIHIFLILFYRRTNATIFFSGLKISALCTIFIIFISLSSYLDSHHDKPLFSGIALIVLVMSGFIFSLKFRHNSKEIANEFSFVLFVLFLFGWYEITIGVRHFGYENQFKPIFPFSEHSHYAMAVGLIGFVAGVRLNYKLRVIIFGNYLAQALILPNLTLLIFSILSVFMFFPIRRRLLMFLLLSLVSGPTFLLLFSDGEIVNYFLSRIDFSSDSDNLTALVYQQGLLDAWTSLTSANGGLGFQMMGISNDLNEIGKKIVLRHGRSFNTTGGGFLASKIVTELGLLGLLIVILFSYQLFKSFLFIYRFNLNAHHIHTPDYSYIRLQAMFHAAVCAFSVEFFLRGYGYFSPQLLILYVIFLACKGSKTEYELRKTNLIPK